MESPGSKDSKLIWENYLGVSPIYSPSGNQLIEHDCATHVEHDMYGRGECLKEQHHLSKTGDIDWYTVQFEHGIEQVPTTQLKVLQFEKHSHGMGILKKKRKGKMKEDVKMAGTSSGTTGGFEQREDSSRYRPIK